MTAIRRPSRRLDTVPQRLLSLSLAVTTAVGLVGVLAVRSAQESAATQTSDEASDSGSQDVSTTGLTQAALDDYAAQLEAERLRLKEYRAELVAVAADLQAQANVLATGGRTVKIPKSKARVSVPSAVTAPKGKSAPKGKPAPKAAAPKAQAQSKSS